MNSNRIPAGSRAGTWFFNVSLMLSFAAGICIPGWTHAVPIHNTYAVLFSGGVDASNNHLRYYEETYFPHFEIRLSAIYSRAVL